MSSPQSPQDQITGQEILQQMKEIHRSIAMQAEAETDDVVSSLVSIQKAILRSLKEVKLSLELLHRKVDTTDRPRGPGGVSEIA
ncbi:hypothetical protein N7I30_21140 [Aurantimonas litoralis]|nr:hypothetical protein [Aurantimonas litoralis]